MQNSSANLAGPQFIYEQDEAFAGSGQIVKFICAEQATGWCVWIHNEVQRAALCIESSGKLLGKCVVSIQSYFAKRGIVYLREDAVE